MSLSEDIKLYLPRYLSADSQAELFSGLKDFPDKLDQRFYTDALAHEEIIFQGDGIRRLLAIQLPEDLQPKIVNGIILSNTCDTFGGNIRAFSSRIVYAPIVTLAKYIARIEEKKIDNFELKDHIQAIKKQYVTQILFLPEIKGRLEDSIVFLDGILNIKNSFINRSELKHDRIFTLSNLGHYILLIKLSIHFSRIQERVDRDQGLVM